jgi:hypothetical protein
MTYADYEYSQQDGRPVRLYEFMLENSVWRYNNSTKTIVTTNGYVWLPAAISDDGVRQGGEPVSDVTRITCSEEIGPAQLFKLSAPGGIMLVTIYAKQQEADDYITKYVGEVTQMAVSKPGVIVVSCDTFNATMNRTGLRLIWQRSCPHTVYDVVNCRVNPALHARDVTIIAINGLTVTVDSIAGTPEDGLYGGGFLEFQHPVKGLDALAIEAQAGNQLLMFGSVDGLYLGMKLKAYRGCDQTASACISFGNYKNYGGIPHLPGTSPFDGIASALF